MTDKIIVFVTCASLGEAQAIAAAVLDRRLAACVSLGPSVQSLFNWKGERETSSEISLTFKSRLDRWPALEAEIRRLHSYEVPEILAVPVAAGSADYLRWMDESLDRRAEAEAGPA